MYKAAARSQAHFRPRSLSAGHAAADPLSRFLAADYSAGAGDEDGLIKRNMEDSRREAAVQAMQLLENLAMATKVSTMSPRFYVVRWWRLFRRGTQQVVGFPLA